MFITTDREAGNEIERFATLAEAEAAVKAYEDGDKADNFYEPDFYAIEEITEFYYVCDSYRDGHGDSYEDGPYIRLREAENVAAGILAHLTDNEKKSRTIAIQGYEVEKNYADDPDPVFHKEMNATYEVSFCDDVTGATSPIDTITAPDGYTAEQYIKHCEMYADSEYCEMLKNGTVIIAKIG